MPTTATVAPPRCTVEDVGTGLNAILRLIWDVPLTLSPGTAALNADLNVSDRASVQEAARALGSTVEESHVGPVTVVKTVGVLAGVRLTVHTVIHEPAVLRRDLSATAELAERDA